MRNPLREAVAGETYKINVALTVPVLDILAKSVPRCKQPYDSRVADDCRRELCLVIHEVAIRK